MTETPAPSANKPLAPNPEEGANAPIQPGSDTPAPGGEPPASGEQPKEPVPEPAAPETYEPFNAPEGVEITDQEHATLSEHAKAMGWTQEAAQKNVDFFHKTLKEMGEQHEARAEEARDIWKKDSLKDKEIGGERFEENKALNRRVLDSFSDPVKDENGEVILDDTGRPISEAGQVFGEVLDNPVIGRFLNRIAKAIGEDSFVTIGDKSGAPEVPIHKRLYPNEANKT